MIEKNSTDADNIKNYLYTMDCYLRGLGYDSASERPATKSAFWTNILLASFIYIVLFPFSAHTSCFFLVVPFILVFISYCLGKIYYKGQYDAVIKTFLVITKMKQAYKRN